MGTEVPYPNGVLERVTRSERRQDATDVTVGQHATAIAVQAEQVKNLGDDVRETNARLTNVLRALWALVLVLIPVAASLVALAIGR